ncbi:hypothetical protein [Streptomyces subrutilus]|uniref:hypothetical protein n=1 Tax=Streptomyces subrutilus TaxID=36818 RepID=UPI00279605F9|nr:hypothetical protein [Streptomyces subrutilus]
MTVAGQDHLTGVTPIACCAQCGNFAREYPAIECGASTARVASSALATDAGEASGRSRRTTTVAAVEAGLAAGW